MVKIKVLIVCSSGGHLDQALMHVPAFEGWEIEFATFSKPDSIERLKEYVFYPVHFPTNRNLKNFFLNLLLATAIIPRTKPDLVFSTGAACAVPFFLVARLLGIRTLYLECFDRIFLPTLTAKLVKNLTTFQICQDRDQLKNWPNRHVLGPSR